MLLDQFIKTPQGLALDDLSQTRSWSELESQSLAVAAYLRSEEIMPGQHVALLMKNRVEFIEIILGCLFAGVWLTPINWHLTAEEIVYIVEDSGAVLLFSEAHFDALTEPLNLVVSNVDDNGGFNANPEHFALNLTDPPGGVMMYTSGTTGKPKGVKRSPPATLRDALSAQALGGMGIGLDGSGPHLVTGPLYHAAPMLYALYDLANGAPMIIMPSFDTERAITLIAERGVRHTHWVPTMFVRALRLRESLPDELGSLTLVLHGAAPIAPSIKQSMLEWWGPVLVEYWGGSESGIITRADSEQWLAHPGTVGKALAQFEVFAGDSKGQRLPAGEQGILCVRHKRMQQPFFYHENPEKTASSYLQPGVFSLGDIGIVDAEGYVYLQDRESNMIISGGVNIYPAEIESVLQLHPAVVDIAVFGIPNEEWGEEIKAVVELESMLAPEQQVALAEELHQFAANTLAVYKLPRSFDFVDQLPRFDTGKLYVRRLKEAYWQGSGRSI